MNDTIVQEVSDIRAAIAAEFGYDRTKLIAWARGQTKRRETLGNTRPSKTLAATGGAAKSPVARKRRVRPARVSG
ncbi:MAG: hypothetical protein ACKVY0_18365 [Prosthecobacter sp.]|uniref:hypothetical protein n=1 Tax=Prosthecobacter sp. TaxID=1965333 RepID=UPI0038FF174F